MKEILKKVTADKLDLFWQLASERCGWSYQQMSNRRAERIKLTPAERTVLAAIADEITQAPII